MTLAMLHFIRPYWLLALLPWALLAWVLHRHPRGTNSWAAICDPHLFPHLIVNSTRRWIQSPLWLLSTITFIAVIALAGPSLSEKPQAVYRTQGARILVLDTSSMMQAKDLRPSRLSRAKFKLLDLLKRQREGRTSLVVFTDLPFVVTPLTEDTATIAALMPQISTNIMPVDGHNIGKALEKARDLLRQGGAETGDILLLTANQPTANDLSIAKRLRASKIRISVLGVGTEEGAPIPLAKGGFATNRQGHVHVSQLNLTALKQLAHAGGGDYQTFTNSDHDLNALLTSQNNHDVSQANSTTLKTQLWHDQGIWLVLLLVLLALPLFRRGFIEWI